MNNLELPKPRFEVDTRVSLIDEPVVFGKEIWEVQDGVHIKPGKPGTWTPAPKAYHKVVHAILACPACSAPSALHKEVHTVDNLGKVRPSFICKAEQCEFHRDVILDEWQGKKLYALSYYGRDKIEILYTHAATQAEARKGAPHIADADIIAIGPAVGFAGRYADASMVSGKAES